jgi:hypothetical protein
MPRSGNRRARAPRHDLPSARGSVAGLRRSSSVIQRSTDSTGAPTNEEGRTGGPPGRRSIYLVGHGIFVLSDAMFRVPENTSVRFYVLVGRSMGGQDAIDIVAGTLNPSTEEVFEAGTLCPNMTLQSERDDPPLPGNATEQMKLSWRNRAQLKQQNEDNARGARARGDDILQVDKDTTLESIVLAKPGFDYAWTCCRHHSSLKELDPSQTPVKGTVLGPGGGVHLLGGGGNKIERGSAFDYDRVGEAGGWYETKSRRNDMSKTVGRIETVEMLSSRRALALQVLLSDETLSPAGKFKSYTVFVKAEVLQENPSFKSLRTEPSSGPSEGEFSELQGKKLTMMRPKFFDKAQRSVRLEKPSEFSISG